MYTVKELTEFISVNDVKFIRLAFCDAAGAQKNLSIMPLRLPEAMKKGITCAYAGGEITLKPDLSTLQILPWRPQTGRVIRFYCSVFDGKGAADFDKRAQLAALIKEKKAAGKTFTIGFGAEFRLYKADMEGENSGVPFDEGGAMDTQPLDKGADIRREIALTLDEMGIAVDSSCHAAQPGQNILNFKGVAPLTAADNFLTYKSVVTVVAGRNGLCASFEKGNALYLDIMNVKGKRQEKRAVMDGLDINPYSVIAEMIAKL